MEAMGAFELGSELRASVGLVVYSAQEDGRNEEAPASLITRHEVHLDGSHVPTLLGGRAVGVDELRTLFGSLCESVPQKRTLLDERLLFCDNTRLLWWSVGRRRPMRFSTADKAFNDDVSGKPALHPTLLFLARPGNLYVFALEEPRRPRPSTLVFTAPYCNLYSGGHMCNGNVKLPTSLDASAIDAWEEIFFDSAFTHSNLSQKLTAHEGGHNALWREMVQPSVQPASGGEAEEVFPAKYLAPSFVYGANAREQQSRPRTVEDVLNQ